MTSQYQKIRIYSPVQDCYVVRVSMWDEQGGEFFVNIPDDRGFKALRETINGIELPMEHGEAKFVPGALDAIMDAIERNDDPGEVKFDREAMKL